MSEASGTEKRKYGFPGETFRQIITKAVCGTAQKSLNYTHYAQLPNGVVPNQVLGCSVTELRLHEPEVKNSNTQPIILDIGGIFEVHVWYAYNNGKETDVLRCPVHFEDSLTLEDYNCQNTSKVDAKVKIDKSPVIVESEITADNQIKLEIELAISAEIIGETQMLVQVFVPGE